MLLQGTSKLTVITTLLLLWSFNFKAFSNELTFYGVAYPQFEQAKARELTYDRLKQLQQYHLRLSVNWAEIETKKGDYDFHRFSSSWNSRVFEGCRCF